MKKTTCILFALAIALLLVGCTPPPSNTLSSPNVANQKLSIDTTFFPLYSLTQSIVGDRAAVYSIVPAGVEPHDYEATTGDIEKLNSANAFVSLGLEFAPFEDQLISSLKPSVKVIPVGTGIQQLKISSDKRIPGGLDPHVWLSPKNAKLMVTNILNGLLMVDPQHGAEYQANAQDTQKQLDVLDAEFKTGLSSCQKHVVLVNHNAFSYLGRDYGFKTIYISGLEPEGEPTPGQIKQLIDQAKENNLQYILYESLVDPRVANTIATEVGAQTLKLDPLEGTNDPTATYFTLMRENLNTLKIALGCQ